MLAWVLSGSRALLKLLLGSISDEHASSSPTKFESYWSAASTNFFDWAGAIKDYISSRASSASQRSQANQICNPGSEANGSECASYTCSSDLQHLFNHTGCSASHCGVEACRGVNCHDRAGSSSARGGVTPRQEVVWNKTREYSYPFARLDVH